MVKNGETVRIEHKPARPNEYREKIGPAAECYLVFKGQTKIGMIPRDFANEHPKYLRRKVCKISSVDKENKKILVFFNINEQNLEKSKDK